MSNCILLCNLIKYVHSATSVNTKIASCKLHCYVKNTPINDIHIYNFVICHFDLCETERDMCMNRKHGDMT